MSSFSATCNRLSQFIKENKKGLSASPMAMDVGIATHQPPTTKNLLQCLDVPLVDDGSVVRLFPQQQLTIFYGDKLLVFDDFPAGKASDLINMVTATAAPSTAAATVVGGHLPTGELALASRRSLLRFFEKRKNRIKSKAPYQLNGSFLVSNKAEVVSQSQHSQPQPRLWLKLGH